MTDAINRFVFDPFIAQAAACLTLLLAPIQGLCGQKENTPERIEALIKIFAHPQAGAEKIDDTSRAIQALVAIGKPAVPQLTHAMLGKNASVAIYSALTLDEIGRPAVEIVRAGWPKWSEAEKWEFMRFRGKFDYVDSLPFALKSLDSNSPDVRRRAIKYFALHKEAKARPQLLKMLNTELPQSHRWLVLETLAEIGHDAAAEDALIALLAKGSWAAKGDGLVLPDGFTPRHWPDGRGHVVTALGKMGSRKSAPKLLELLQENGPNQGYLDLYIVPLLGEFGHVPSIPVLKRILAEDKECCKEVIAIALFRLKDRSAISILTKGLHSKMATERYTALRVFARYGDRSDVLMLGQHLRDSDIEVRILACEGLERITGAMIRSPGQTEITSSAVGLWIAWFENNKSKYEK
jgi:HEAT repeat protein